MKEDELAFGRHALIIQNEQHVISAGGYRVRVVMIRCSHLKRIAVTCKLHRHNPLLSVSLVRHSHRTYEDYLLNMGALRSFQIECLAVVDEIWNCTNRRSWPSEQIRGAENLNYVRATSVIGAASSQHFTAW